MTDQNTSSNIFPEIRTIVFDLGAVLIDWDPRYLYRKIFDDPEEMEYFLTHICTHDWNAQQDAGRSWDEAIEMLAGQHPDYRREIELFWHRWPEMLNGPIDGTVAILENLIEQDTYRLLALTNWSAETWPYAWERYSFLHRFEGIVVSGQEKLKKPDERIYRLLIDRYEVSPEQAVFIDDSPANVAAAARLGFHALHFTGADRLRDELEQLGIRVGASRPSGK